MSDSTNPKNTTDPVQGEENLAPPTGYATVTERRFDGSFISGAGNDIFYFNDSFVYGVGDVRGDDFYVIGQYQIGNINLNDVTGDNRVYFDDDFVINYARISGQGLILGYNDRDGGYSELRVRDANTRYKFYLGNNDTVLTADQLVTDVGVTHAPVGTPTKTLTAGGVVEVDDSLITASTDFGVTLLGGIGLDVFTLGFSQNGTLNGRAGADYYYLTRFQESTSLNLRDTEGSNHFIVEAGVAIADVDDSGEAIILDLANGGEIRIAGGLTKYSFHIGDLDKGTISGGQFLTDYGTSGLTVNLSLLPPSAENTLTIADADSNNTITGKEDEVDIFDVSGTSSTNTVNLIAGTAKIGTTDYTLESIENYIGGSGRDTITGNDDNNFLNGGAGNDVLKGGAGNDILDGGADRDRLTGGAGNDGFLVSSGGDTIEDFSITDDVIFFHNATIAGETTPLIITRLGFLRTSGNAITVRNFQIDGMSSLLNITNIDIVEAIDDLVLSNGDIFGIAAMNYFNTGGDGEGLLRFSSGILVTDLQDVEVLDASIPIFSSPNDVIASLTASDPDTDSAGDRNAISFDTTNFTVTLNDTNQTTDFALSADGELKYIGSGNVLRGLGDEYILTARTTEADSGAIETHTITLTVGDDASLIPVFDENVGGTAALNHDLGFTLTGGNISWTITDIAGVRTSKTISKDNFIFTNGTLTLDADGLNREAITGEGDIGILALTIQAENNTGSATQEVVLQVNGVADEAPSLTQVNAGSTQNAAVRNATIGNDGTATYTIDDFNENGRTAAGGNTILLRFTDNDIGPSSAVRIGSNGNTIDASITISGDKIGDDNIVIHTGADYGYSYVSFKTGGDAIGTKNLINGTEKFMYTFTVTANSPTSAVRDSTDPSDMINDYVFIVNLTDIDDEDVIVPDDISIGGSYNQNDVIVSLTASDPDMVSAGSAGRNAITFSTTNFTVRNTTGTDISRSFALSTTGELRYIGTGDITIATGQAYTLTTTTTETDSGKAATHTVNLTASSMVTLMGGDIIIAITENSPDLSHDLGFTLGGGNITYTVTDIEGVRSGKTISEDNFVITNGVLTLDADGLDRDAIAGDDDIGALTVTIQAQNSSGTETRAVTINVEGVADEKIYITNAFVGGGSNRDITSAEGSDGITTYTMNENFRENGLTVGGTNRAFTIQVADDDVGSSSHSGVGKFRGLDLNYTFTGDEIKDYISDGGGYIYANSYYLRFAVNNNAIGSNNIIKNDDGSFSEKLIYTFTLNISSPDGGTPANDPSDDHVFIVKFADIDEEQTLLSARQADIATSTTNGDVVYTATFGEPDTNTPEFQDSAAITSTGLAASKGDNDKFSFNASNGKLTYTSAATVSVDDELVVVFTSQAGSAAVLEHTVTLTVSNSASPAEENHFSLSQNYNIDFNGADRDIDFAFNDTLQFTDASFNDGENLNRDQLWQAIGQDDLDISHDKGNIDITFGKADIVLSKADGSDGEGFANQFGSNEILDTQTELDNFIALLNVDIL